MTKMKIEKFKIEQTKSFLINYKKELFLFKFL